MYGSYRRTFGPEHVAELNRNIDQQHEELLRTDDTDMKADYQRYLAGYAMQYLYLVPHNRKFKFKETERVLHQSAMMIGDFDPREASLAFEYLAKYAHNLLEQPWRKDFHTVKLTSGFYVHNICGHLHNSQELLIAMGYVNIDDKTLKLIPSFDLNILKDVSRDCYVASQECLILSQIWQRVSDQEPDYPLTTGEVFEFRRQHMGDTDTICKTLVADIRRRQHEFKMQRDFQKTHFVPVDRLIEYDGMDGENHVSGLQPERELEIVQKVLHNTKMQLGNDHIYDPVYNGKHNGNGHGISPFSSNFVFPPNVAIPQYPNRMSTGQSQLREVKYRDMEDDRDSLSPMIPKTVANFCSNPSPLSRNISHSSSASSIARGVTTTSFQPNGHLNFTKVIDDEIRNSREKPVPEKKIWTESHGDQMRREINNSNWVEGYTQEDLINGPPTLAGRSRRPIAVYPEENFPQAKRNGVPGVPMQSFDSITSSLPNRYYPEENAQDVLNEAIAYASEISDFVPKEVADKSRKQRHSLEPRQLLTTAKSGWETDSRSASSDSRMSSERDSDKKSPSSTDASSWENSSEYRKNSGSMRRHSCQQQSRETETTNYTNRMHMNKISTNQVNRPSHIDISPSSTLNGAERYPLPVDFDIKSVNSIQTKYFHSEARPESDIQNGRKDIRNRSGNYRDYSELGSGSSPSPTSPKPSAVSGQPDSLESAYYNFLVKSKQTDEVMGLSNEREYETDKVSPSPSASSVNRRSLMGDNTSSKEIANSTRQYDKLESNVRNGVTRNSENRRMINDSTFTISDEPSTNVEENPKPLPSAQYKIPPSNLRAKIDTEKNIPDKDINRKIAGNSAKPERVPVENEIIMEPWECKFCTYRNTVKERICEMCSKSKDFVESPNAEIPDSPKPFPKLYSDAARGLDRDQRVPERKIEIKTTSTIDSESEQVECSQCTLLNPRTARMCEVCGQRLKSLEDNLLTTNGFV